MPHSFALDLPYEFRFSENRLTPTPNHRHESRRPAPFEEGRFAIVTNVGRGMRWTQVATRGERRNADGEIVWLWRPLAGAKPAD